MNKILAARLIWSLHHRASPSVSREGGTPTSTSCYQLNASGYRHRRERTEMNANTLSAVIPQPGEFSALRRGTTEPCIGLVP